MAVGYAQTTMLANKLLFVKNKVRKTASFLRQKLGLASQNFLILTIASNFFIIFVVFFSDLSAIPQRESIENLPDSSAHSTTISDHDLRLAMQLLVPVIFFKLFALTALLLQTPALFAQIYRRAPS